MLPVRPVASDSGWPLQPLQVPALDEKDVVDQLADGREAAARLHGGVDRGRDGDEPAAPLVALFGE